MASWLGHRLVARATWPRVLGEHAPWESHALPGLTLCLADLLFE